ncbi:ATP-binding protein [Limibacter armeniacum]|uniref:sensor histidine kinase n=1 Tax=Limibacter armeniacum TaxID=466084 RepID=UPI002FE55A70
MGFKNFKLNVTLRVLGLCITIFALLILIKTAYMATIIFFVVLVVYQAYALINLMENTNREMVDFLSSIRYDDFSQTYNLKGRGGSFDELNEEFNKVLSRFKEVRAEKEADYQYLKNIIHHIGIGILSFDNDGRVQIINTVAKRLFKLNRLRNIEDLRAFSPDLYKQLKELRTGSKALVRIRDKDDTIQLAVYAIELYLRGDVYKLVTVQNIHHELEEQEMEAWQNLIRVLTHEIMNSVTPVSSLANTLEDEINYFKEKKANGEMIEDDELEDMNLAVSTIKRRSDGMIRFVNEFRNLTQVPVPQLEHVQVADIFGHIQLLMGSECESNDITLKVEMEPQNIVVTADMEQIEQVLINLVKNAVQALQENGSNDGAEKEVVLTGGLGKGNRPVIKVKDNGPGIEPEALDRIFIPFFTTKKQGSGIGLSLSRQIMRQHKGAITVASHPGEGTEFTLKF